MLVWVMDEIQNGPKYISGMTSSFHIALLLINHKLLDKNSAWYSSIPEAIAIYYIFMLACEYGSISSIVYMALRGY